MKNLTRDRAARERLNQHEDRIRDLEERARAHTRTIEQLIATLNSATALLARLVAAQDTQEYDVPTHPPQEEAS